MTQNFVIFVFLSSLIAVARGTGSDYLSPLPATIYEDSVISPQNADFDAANNRFVPHAAWYNDRLLHYYKFRMFVPDFYPAVANSPAIPIGRLFVPSTNATFAGAVGKPIAEFYTSDGTDYSDFVEVVFVSVDATYNADEYKSTGDVTSASGATLTPSGILLNLPIVPQGATLEDPANPGNDAPIEPVRVWYRGEEATAYVFEVSDMTAAEYFAYTRTTTDAAYAIPVVNFGTSSAIFFIPLWFVNQYEAGVGATNHGGPNPMGMKNVFGLDRGDAGYSPLWQLYWVTKAPVNFTVDQASHPAQFTNTNGFEWAMTPMYVNCPNIGAVGAMNTNKAMSFSNPAYIEAGETYVFSGSLVMNGSIAMQAALDSDPTTPLATSTTSPMGMYSLSIDGASITSGAAVVATETVSMQEQARWETTASMCLTVAPPTVYEDFATNPNPQNADYDLANNRFPAHSGWKNDWAVSYYKFRMMVPPFYPTATMTGVFPVGRVFLVTTNGTLEGVVGNPIAEFHTQDGEMYSDFVEFVFVAAPSGYTADTFTSYMDIMQSGATLTSTGMYGNLPVVPLGSTLEDPSNPGTDAPVQPITLWYRCVQIQAFIFEVTDLEIAEHFAWTRTDPADWNFAIHVVNFVFNGQPSFAPLYFVNQYEEGVTASNHGGPNPNGMKNVMGVDRGDPGYSPLWNMFWVTRTPPNFAADQASHPAQFNSANGFEFAITPMYVNCPNVGPVGGLNTAKVQMFPDLRDVPGQTYILSGSLVMMEGITMALTYGENTNILQSGDTSPMGMYTFTVTSDSLTSGTDVVVWDATPWTIHNRWSVAANECLASAPATVYEDFATNPNPQNSDFDLANNRFPAHPAWYNDLAIHYYKFRMIVPPFYPMATASGIIPTNNLYIMTTDGTLAGSLGDPVVQYHTQDGELYSDFMKIYLVTVPSGYSANDFTSYDQIEASSATVQATPTLFANIPIVPTGSRLEDPANLGSNAPITSISLWYRCTQVDAYVFEVNDASLATFWAGTRSSSDASYAISVESFWQTDGTPSFIPLYFINQYESGVTNGVNSGGPNPNGMKNVFGFDRGDPGYSPLWQMFWVTQVPLDFSADHVSNPAQITQANGFEFVQAPMYVNCPNIGPVGTQVNPAKVDSFHNGYLAPTGSVLVQGSLVMEGGVDVILTLQPVAAESWSATTSPMGAYSFTLAHDVVYTNLGTNFANGVLSTWRITQELAAWDISIDSAQPSITSVASSGSTLPGTADPIFDQSHTGGASQAGSSPDNSGSEPAANPSARVLFALALFALQ